MLPCLMLLAGSSYRLQRKGSIDYVGIAQDFRCGRAVAHDVTLGQGREVVFGMRACLRAVISGLAENIYGCSNCCLSCSADLLVPP